MPSQEEGRIQYNADQARSNAIGEWRTQVPGMFARTELTYSLFRWTKSQLCFIKKSRKTISCTISSSVTSTQTRRPQCSSSYWPSLPPCSRVAYSRSRNRLRKIHCQRIIILRITLSARPNRTCRWWNFSSPGSKMRTHKALFKTNNKMAVCLLFGQFSRTLIRICNHSNKAHTRYLALRMNTTDESEVSPWRIEDRDYKMVRA